jgi:hypothetical protein
METSYGLLNTTMVGLYALFINNVPQRESLE